MAAQFKEHYSQDLTEPIRIRQEGNIVFNSDDESNVIYVDLYEDGEDYSGGGSVAGLVICPDGATVTLSGSVSGKTVSVTLTEDCFAITGQIGVGIQVVSGGIKTTVFKAVYNVELNETDNPVDPGSRTALTVGDLVDDIATAVATIPATYTDLMAAVAPTFSQTSNYLMGQYVWYNGKLYKFTANHAAGTWAGSTDTATVAVSNDVFTLRNENISAHNETLCLSLINHGESLVPAIAIPGDINSSDGSNRNTPTIDAAYKRTGYIPLSTGDIITYSGLTALSNHLVVAVYNADKTIDSSLSVAGTGSSATKSGTFTATHNGYVRFASGNYYLTLDTCSVKITVHYGTNDTIAIQNTIPDPVAIRNQIINDGFNNLEDGLYKEQYDKTAYTLSWEVGGIRPSVGDLDDTTTNHIRTGYIPIYSGLPISIDAPDNMKCVVYKYNKQTYTEFAGSAGDYKVGKQRLAIDTFYIKIVAMYLDESTIAATAGADITVAYYIDNQKNIINFTSTEVEKQIEKTTLTPVWQQGTISTTSGSPEDSDYSIRTGYIRIKGGSAFTVNFNELYKITIHEYDRQSVDDWLGMLTTDLTTGYFSYSVESDTDIRIVVSARNGDTVLPSVGSSIVLTQYFDKKDLNILVLGNSFSQDSFAYLPPVLNEVLPEFNINYGVCYTTSFSIRDHVNAYNNNPPDKYTSYWEWSNRYNQWKNYTSTGQYDRGKSLADVMALRNWDIIYVQPTCENMLDANYDLNTAQVEYDIINPGRLLLRILQSLTLKPFTFLMGEWMGVMVFDDQGHQVFGEDDNGAYVFGKIAEALQMAQKALGIDGIIPIGAAIQDARTNDTFQQFGLWDHHNMLIADGIHMQSGIAPLMATYTIAKYILHLIGMKRGLYGSSFVPTTENCIAIKAYSESGPKMTHGVSTGVSTDTIQAAQEICTFAINYPNEVVDCSTVIPQPNNE